MDEFKEPHYPVPNLEDLVDSIVVGAFIKDKVIGGFRVFPPGSGPFACFKLLEPDPALPDWRELRRFGAIGEMTSLILLPELRGGVNLADIWQYVKQILRALGSDYALLNGNVKTRAYFIYSALGFKPIAPPIHATFTGASVESWHIPMIIKLGKDLSWPPCVMDIDLTRIESFARQVDKL